MRLRIFIGLMIISLAIPAFSKRKDAPVTEKYEKPKDFVTTVLENPEMNKNPLVGGINVIRGIFSPKKQVVKMISSKFDLNEAQVYKLGGTVMVQHKDGSEPTALGSFDTVEKGDTIAVYDQSWVIFKTRRGDKIGLDGNTVLIIDEYYFGGPDRQVRLVLQKGSLFLKTNNADSRQSFFEINTGSVVTSIGDTQAIFDYDKAKDILTLQYMRGKLKVIDKNEEQKFAYENTTHHWEAGVMKEVEASPMDELDGVNFKRFLDGKIRMIPNDQNMLLQVGQ